MDQNLVGRLQEKIEAVADKYANKYSRETGGKVRELFAIAERFAWYDAHRNGIDAAGTIDEKAVIALAPTEYVVLAKRYVGDVCAYLKVPFEDADVAVAELYARQRVIGTRPFNKVVHRPYFVPEEGVIPFPTLGIPTCNPQLRRTLRTLMALSRGYIHKRQARIERVDTRLELQRDNPDLESTARVGIREIWV
jgi:hypothetical protein